MNRRWLRAAAFLGALALGARGGFAKPPAPADPDGDGDGLSDFQEVHKYGTDPKKADTDGDGKPDGDWEERREFTYSIRCVVEHLPPAAAISDDGQDAREVARSAEGVTLEIVAYPLATPDADIPEGRDWIADAKPLAEYTKPNLTCDFDAGTARELAAALATDGIDVTTLGDRDLVKKVSAWAWRRSRTLSMGFTSFCFSAKGGRLVTERGCEAYVAKACAKEATSEDGKPGGLPAGRSLEKQLDAEVRGASMFSQRIHGSCTSSATYQQTILRMLGIPTRTTVAMPPGDGNDEAQKEMLAKGLRPSALRDAILAGPHGGWTEHTFNTVFVGGRWRRLNYGTLGQPIVDRNYLGLMLRILDYDDIATSGVSATWGKKWALGTTSKAFPHQNPYRLVEVSDLLGAHAKVQLPPSPFDRKVLTITAAAWVTDFTPESLGIHDADALELTFAESVAGEGYEPYTAFAKEADVRFVLRAKGHDDVPAAYSGTTIPRAGVQHMVLSVRRPSLGAGVAYALVPLNERGSRRFEITGLAPLTR